MKAKALASLVVSVALGASGAMAERKVLILSVDGCRPDALHVADTPRIDALAAAGSASYTARNTMTHGGSGPNYSSMFTGVDVPKHGVTSNSMGSDGFAGNHFDQWPHFFSRLEAMDPSLYTAQIVGWGSINPGTWADKFADYTSAGGTSAAGQTFVVSEAVNLLTHGDPDVLALQFPLTDSVGHGYGFSPTVPQYVAAIEQADADYGTVLDALFARPGYVDGSEEWLILTVTDHGGKGTHHDLPSGGQEVWQTFYIATGPNVPTGADLGSPRVFDVAVTALDYMGLDTTGLGLDGSVVIPEPASLVLLAAGGLAVLRRRRAARA